MDVHFFLFFKASLRKPGFRLDLKHVQFLHQELWEARPLGDISEGKASTQKKNHSPGKTLFNF